MRQGRHCDYEVTLNVEPENIYPHPNPMTPEIEAVYSQVSLRVRDTLRTLPSPPSAVYACAFWLFYCDYTRLGEPCFAYNEVGASNEDKWSPPGWKVSVDDDMVKALSPLYRELETLMTGRGKDARNQLVEYQWEFYSDLCQQLTRDAKELLGHWPLADDFVFAILEEREGDETYTRLAEASVGRDLARRLGLLDED